jgi:hypothetical protein
MPADADAEVLAKRAELARAVRADDPCIQLCGTASRAMQDAIAEILSVAGYTVVKDSDDMQPFHLLVMARRPIPSWRERLDAQAEHRQQTLAAAYRTLGSQNQGDAAG